MPRLNFGSEREIMEQMAAECEACWIISDHLFTRNIRDEIPGENWREKIVNLAYDVRNFGDRIPIGNSGVEYDFS